MAELAEVVSRRRVGRLVTEQLSCGHWLEVTTNRLQPDKPQRRCRACAGLPPVPRRYRALSRVVADLGRTAQRVEKLAGGLL